MEPDFRLLRRRVEVVNAQAYCQQGALSTHTKQDRIYIDSASHRKGDGNQFSVGLAAGLYRGCLCEPMDSGGRARPGRRTNSSPCRGAADVVNTKRLIAQTNDGRFGVNRFRPDERCSPNASRSSCFAIFHEN